MKTLGGIKKMAVKVAINGFGRIGRLALRLMANDPKFEYDYVNDCSDAKTFSSLIQIWYSTRKIKAVQLKLKKELSL